ncbi:hypothetical protein HDU84_008962 [Entophlyctis sp. JEL0112]|nr:hypothetical protein HDU84_008962 [Entophlyctis sp. JEL0112]
MHPRCLIPPILVPARPPAFPITFHAPNIRGFEKFKTAGTFPAASAALHVRMNTNWAQIGRATEVINNDLSDGGAFFSLSARGVKGLTDWSIYHEKAMTVSAPFHPRGFLLSGRVGLIPDASGVTEPDEEKMHLPFVRGRLAYGIFVAVLRLMVICAYDEAGIEVVRCKSVRGPARGTDLDSDYKDGSGQVWRRREAEGAGKPAEDSRDGKEDESTRLVVRWLFEGTPRHKLLYAKMTSPLSAPQPTVYEGVFVYTFDSETGLVVNHRLESMTPMPWVPRICRWWLDRRMRARRARGGGGVAGEDGAGGLPQLNNSGDGSK